VARRTGGTPGQAPQFLIQVHVQPWAVADVSEAVAWYEVQRPGLGIEFVLELDAAIERATETPKAYAPEYQEARRVLLRRFPYAVYFLFEGGVVEVFAVLHQHRAPSSWKSRLR
jgi:plasmid stabilization system protein ParE